MSRQHRPDTEIVHAGRHPEDQKGAVNPPVYHASTILFPTLDALEAAQKPSDDPHRVTYGRRGTPTSFVLSDAVAALEGGAGCVLTPSGLSAVSITLLSLLKAGDHLLMVDTCYGPSRNFCNGVLRKLGIETTYYDPLIGAGIAGLIRPNTAVIFLESPGSLTFEVQDVPAIVAAAKAADHRVWTVIDNTWASPHFFKPIRLGVDVSVQAATKYIVGHSDVLIGTISANAEALPLIVKAHGDMGIWTGPDDMYLTQRGLRTLSVRLARHQETGLALARWLQARPEVARVLHPGLEGDPGHALWKRDFTGASGLFGAVLYPVSRAKLAAFLDGLEFFGMGWSWGGFESLCVPQHPESIRTATRWRTDGPLLRFHAGLEDIADLIEDLAAGFTRMAAAE